MPSSLFGKSPSKCRCGAGHGCSVLYCLGVSLGTWPPSGAAVLRVFQGGAPVKWAVPSSKVLKGSKGRVPAKRVGQEGAASEHELISPEQSNMEAPNYYCKLQSLAFIIYI